MGQIKAGLLDRKIKLYARVGIKNASGEEIENLVLFHTCAAHKEQVRYKETERFEADMLTLPKMESFVIRYKQGVSETMTLEYEDRLYDVQSVNEIGRREGMRILVERKNG